MASLEISLADKAARDLDASEEVASVAKETSQEKVEADPGVAPDLVLNPIQDQAQKAVQDPKEDPATKELTEGSPTVDHLVKVRVEKTAREGSQTADALLKVKAAKTDREGLQTADVSLKVKAAKMDREDSRTDFMGRDRRAQKRDQTQEAILQAKAVLICHHAGEMASATHIIQRNPRPEKSLKSTKHPTKLTAAMKEQTLHGNHKEPAGSKMVSRPDS